MSQKLLGKHASSATSILSFKNTIRGASLEAAGISKGRGTLSLKEIPNAVAWLIRTPAYWKSIRPLEYPHTHKAFRNGHIYEKISAAREIVWAAAVCSHHSARIERFLATSASFYTSIISADFAGARRAWDTIFEANGFSFWGIENNIFLLAKESGLESQKTYATELKNSADIDPITAWVVHYLSVLNEDSVTFGGYLDQLTTNIDPLPDGLKPWLRYRLIDEIPPTDEALADFFRWEIPSPIIDYYASLIRVVTSVLAKSGGYSKATRTACELALEILSMGHGDRRVGRLVMLNSQIASGNWVQWKRDLTLANALAKGKFDDINANPSAVSAADDLQLALEAAEIRANLQLKSVPAADLFSEISNLAQVILTWDGSFRESFAALAKIKLCLRNACWAPILEHFLIRLIARRPQPYESAVKRFVEVPQLEPSIIEALPTMLCEPLRKVVKEIYGSTPAVQLTEISVQGVEAPTDKLAVGEVCRALAAYEYANDDFEEGLKYSEEVINGGIKSIKPDAIRIKCQCLLQLKRNSAVVEFVSQTLLDDENFHYVIPFSEIALLCDRDFRKAFAGEIWLPIFFDFYFRFFKKDLNNRRRFAYDDFLRAYDLKRPSELLDFSEKFGLKNLVYYLRYLCVPSVMDCSLSFTGSKDLEEERLKICRVLTELDPANSEIYQQESKEFSRKHLIQKGIQHIEQSRIYVDTEGIQSWCDRNLNEQYARYMEFLRAGYAGVDQAEVQKAIQKTISGESLSPGLFGLPANEASDLLQRMVISLRDQFALSPEHGLDCYLSMRIRHGTLSGQLREPLERETLLSQRDEKTNQYLLNESWRERLEFLDPKIAGHALKLLAEFSKAFDSMIEHLVKEVIQVKVVPEGRGMFDLSLRKLHIAIIAAETNGQKSLSDFATSCFSLFWILTQHSLESIKTLLEDTFRAGVITLFTELQGELSKCCALGELNELEAAVRRAQTAVLQSIDRVIEWFQLSEKPAQIAFSLADVVEIGLQSVQNLHPAFKPLVSTDIPPELAVFSEQLSFFTDILFIVFENIFRHSGLPTPRIYIQVSRTTSALAIRVESQMTEGRPTPEDFERVEEIRTAIREGQFLSGAKKEGGSGLMKLRRIVREAPDHKMNFGFNDRNEFYLDIYVPIIGEVSREDLGGRR